MIDAGHMLFESKLVKYKKIYTPTVIRTSKDAEKIIREIYSDDDIGVQETFYALYLNTSNDVVGFSLISIGGISSTVVDQRLIIKQALDRLATGIILCHNHPSGATKPSSQDISITKKVEKACQLFDIKILDHIIVAEDSYFSFTDEGLI